LLPSTFFSICRLALFSLPTSIPRHQFLELVVSNSARAILSILELLPSRVSLCVFESRETFDTVMFIRTSFCFFILCIDYLRSCAPCPCGDRFEISRFILKRPLLRSPPLKTSLLYVISGLRMVFLLPCILLRCSVAEIQDFLSPIWNALGLLNHQFFLLPSLVPFSRFLACPPTLEALPLSSYVSSCFCAHLRRFFFF